MSINKNNEEFQKQKARERQLVQMYQMMQTGLSEIMKITQHATNELPQEILESATTTANEKNNTTNEAGEDKEGQNNNSHNNCDQEKNELLIGGLFSAIENIHVVAYSLSRLLPPVNVIVDVDMLDGDENETDRDDNENNDDDKSPKQNDDEEEPEEEDFSPILAKLLPQNHMTSVGRQLNTKSNNHEDTGLGNGYSRRSLLFSTTTSAAEDASSGMTSDDYGNEIAARFLASGNNNVEALMMKNFNQSSARTDDNHDNNANNYDPSSPSPTSPPSLKEKQLDDFTSRIQHTADTIRKLQMKLREVSQSSSSAVSGSSPQ